MFRHSRGGVENVGVKQNMIWKSGVGGLYIILPDNVKIDKSVIPQEMTKALGVNEWAEIRGPDTMFLR
jgi:hypothetical protein